MSDRLPRNDPFIAICDATLAMHAAEAVPLLHDTVAQARASQQPFHLAYALSMLARALSMAEHRALAEPPAQESLALFRSQGSLGGQAMALNALGIIAVGRGEHARALDCLNQALPLARDANWPELSGRIANTLGVTLNDMGRHAQAAAVLEEAWSATAPLGESNRLSLRLMNNLSLALSRWAQKERDQGLAAAAWRPRAQRAAVLARDGTTACRERQAADLALTLDNLATALIVLDELDEGHLALDEAEAIFAQVGDDHSLVFVAGNRARAFLQGGRPELAIKAIQAGFAAADRARVVNHLDELYRLLSTAWEAAGDHEQALAAHKRFHDLRTRFVLEAAEEQAQVLAVTLETERAVRESRQDVLTGLANRRGFDESLSRMLPRASVHQAIALVVLDLDHFKLINDQHGHLMGDEALGLVARILREQCRETDITARLGGDEFALVVTGPPASAHALCERVREALTTASLAHWPNGPQLTMSIGIAVTEQPVSSRELMVRADSALYAAKASGRNAIREA